MHDVVDEVARLYAAGDRFALATVVGTWLSAPRQPGAAMVVAADGEPIGSVSRRLRRGRRLRARAGGDGQRRARSAAVRRQRRRRVRGRADLRRDHRRLRRAGRPGDLPRAAGRRGVDPGARAGRRRDRRRRPRRRRAPTWWCGRTARPASLGTQRLDQAVADDVRGDARPRREPAAAHRPGRRAPAGRAEPCSCSRSRRRRGCSSSAPSTSPPRSRGSASSSATGSPCATRGRSSRRRKRFPDADEVVVEWPHRYLATQQVDARTVICVLTHDPKFDVPLLEAALRTDAAYIGAMGSRRTHDDRLARLRDEGVPRGGAGPAVLADRAGHRRPHARGDRRLDRRRDRRRTAGAAPARRSPRHRRPDPHRGASARDPRKPPVIMREWFR